MVSMKRHQCGANWRHVGGFAALLFICVLAFATACGPLAPHDGTPDDQPVQVDPAGRIAHGFQLAAAAGQFGADLAADRGDWIGCVVSASIAEGAATVAPVIEGVNTARQACGTFTFPALQVNVGQCLAIAQSLPPGTDVPADVASRITDGLAVVNVGLSAFGADLQARDPVAFRLAQGGVSYLSGWVDPVVAMVRDQSGDFTVPAYAVDLGACP